MNGREGIPNADRFAFGKNWRSFLSVVDEERIRDAQTSLCDFLGLESLAGMRFLDVGSGSGLFSLAARRLGAEVHSFDYDPESVKCAEDLKRRYFPDDPDWRIEQGSVLDRDFMENLGQFDVCYAWGVLHHTGSLWQALSNVHVAVVEGGLLFVGIYNDQDVVSAIWERIKRTYCSGELGRTICTAVFYPAFFLSGLVIDVLHLRNPARRYKEHKRRHRGMSLVHDWKDWLGGYPYEPARPQRVISFFENLGYTLSKFKRPEYGFGNNEFLLKKEKREAR
ncbi:MAG: class I SAM-dependent methyltransferase [Candidatus Sumerlaeota bacterium]|nr:class I SAM-dependent methyltransferase [Candidatus Sumerlaeota bacterium]